MGNFLNEFGAIYVPLDVYLSLRSEKNAHGTMIEALRDFMIEPGGKEIQCIISTRTICMCKSTEMSLNESKSRPGLWKSRPR